MNREQMQQPLDAPQDRQDAYAQAIIQGLVAHHGLPSIQDRERLVQGVWELAAELEKARSKARAPARK